MTKFKKLWTMAAVAAAMLVAGAAPVIAQAVDGGDTECDTSFVIDDWTIAGGYPIIWWHIERTCVTILDDA